jgi:hypothetical protein
VVKPVAGSSFRAAIARLIAGIRSPDHESYAAFTVTGKSASSDGHVSKTVVISAADNAAIVE